MHAKLTRRAAIHWTGAAFALPVTQFHSSRLETWAMPFIPKFADLVRNIASVSGTGPVALGQAVSGFASLTDAVSAGEQFYYCIQGLDKPQEREVGRGTLQADGRVARQPISGAATNFTTGAKTIALVAPAEWFARIEQLGGEAMATAISRPELAARESGHAFLAEPGRAGSFVFDPSDLSAMVAADPMQGIHVPPSTDPSGASGAWVRIGWRELDPRWFGAVPNDSADCSPAINAAFRMAEALSIGGATNGTIYRGGPTINLGVGKYFCSSTWEPLATLRIQGAGGLGWGAGTQVRFPAGVTGIRAQAHNTSGATAVDATPHFAGDALVVQDVYFLGGFSGTEGEHHGVHAKRPVHIERCTFDNFEGDGLYGRTTFGSATSTEGNTNVLRAINCLFTNCRSGVAAQYADSNAWRLLGCSFINNRRWGWEERSFLGNHGDGHFDGNARTAWNSGGVGRPCSYVSHGGNWYFAIEGQEAWCSVNAPSGTSADNQGWGYWRPGGPSALSGVPAWTSGIDIRSGGPLLISGLSNGSSALAIHIESNGVSQLDQGALVTGVVPDCVAVSSGVLSRNRVGTVIAASGGLRFGGNLNIAGDFNCKSVTNHIGPQTGPAADSELRLHNTNVASVIKGYSWPAGTSSGEIWLSYSGINGMLLRGQQKIRFDIGGIEQCSIGPAGFETAGIGKVYKVGGSQVVGPRKGGWAAATGTATRTSFDTSTVSLQQLAERVKALIDDLHETAGHGLIGS